MKELLNGEWKVRLDPEQRGIVENWAQFTMDQEYTLTVPGCIQQLDCLSDDYPPSYDLRNGYLGTFFLEKEVILPMLRKGEHCRLFIGGAAPTCHVWVNGSYLTRNVFGITGFELDITQLVKKGTNRITIAITEQYDTLVRGMRFEGADWSGVFGDVAIEITGSICFKNSYISEKNGMAFFCSLVENYDEEKYSGIVEINIEDRVFTSTVLVEPGQSYYVQIPVDVAGLPRWSFREPNLISVSIKCVDTNEIRCQSAFKTGLREIATRGNRIIIDEMPTFFAGAGEEYYSPTIAPLTNLELITARFRALQSYGFNYFRYHTHIPTEQELCVADELGLMVSMEFGVVSNFNKMDPIDKAMDMMELYINQTRVHPSLIIYGLGNEGSQLMAESAYEREKARIGYEKIKKNTTNQLAIIAYGIQGEIPELQNDIETPHLWSENFVWAYDGMTDIPWKALKDVVGKRPNILHEYGKFCSWPSREDERNGTISGGAKPSYGTESYRWLEEHNWTNMEQQLIETSRLAVNCNSRILLEEGRRQSFVNGYILWTFFRDGWRGRGLCDDVGKVTNGAEKSFRKGPNAELTILIDRGFQNRTFPCQINQKVNLYISNFSKDNFYGRIRLRLECEKQTIQVYEQFASANVGDTCQATTFEFSVPAAYSSKCLTLYAELVDNEIVKAENEWEFWAYDVSADLQIDALLYVKDVATYRLLHKVFPNAHRLTSVDSIVIGCRSWEYPQLLQTALKYKNTIIIADEYDDIIKSCVENGCKVLMIDTGNLPSKWICENLYENLADRDVSRFFTSFRAGWDRGNIATIARQDPRIGDFSSAGYFDLRFFDMIQYARPLDTKKIKQEIQTEVNCILSSVARMKTPQEQEAVVQDINAIKEQKSQNINRFYAREQGYLVSVGENLLICTLHLTDNAAGIGLLKQIVNCI